MMKKNRSDFFPVLLLGLLANALLRLHTGYWSRAGLLLAPLSILLLTALLTALTACWPAARCAPVRWGLCLLLALSSALEVLRLYTLFDSAYPGTIGLAATCFTVLVPVVYLRREPALRQTANAVLAGGAVCMGILVLSVAPRLRVVNLQTAALTPADWRDAAAAQLTLSPEHLLFALWPQQGRGDNRCKAVRLATGAVAFDAGIHLLLELFFGAAMPGRLSPVQAAAQCGALSIFNRLEWLQILLWCMAAGVRLGLYLYAMVELSGGSAGRGNPAVGLDRCFVYLAAMALLCAVLRGTALEQAFALRSAACWGFAAVILMTGGLRWFIPHGRRCA